MRALVLGSIALGLFVAALDAYVVVTLLPRMMADLGLEAEHLERATPVITGFLLGYIVTMPLLGAMSDAYGRAPVYLASLGLFAVGSLVTATAGLAGAGEAGATLGPFAADSLGLPWLVAGRVLQGVGGGALVPVALAVAADLYPAGRRAQALGLVAGLQESGSVLGPLYGAALAAGLGGWRAVFWINIPLAAACAGGFLLARRHRGPGGSAPELPTSEEPAASSRAERPRVDWLGACLLGLGLGLLVLALYPDNPEQHAAGPLLVPLGALAFLVLALYARRQAKGPDPLVPRELLRNRVFIGANVTNLLVGAGLMVALVDVPILARGVFHLTELGGALLLARFMIAIPFGAVAGGWLSGRLGYRWTATAGLLLAAAMFMEMSAWSAGELSLRVFGLPPADVTLALCGIGFGVVIAPVAAAILDRARDREHGLASSLVVLARSTGMLLGLSALTAVGLHRFFQLFRQGPALQLVPGSPDFAAQEHAFRARFTLALLAEYHEIFLVTALVLAIAAAVALVTLRGGGRAAARISG